MADDKLSIIQKVLLSAAQTFTDDGRTAGVITGSPFTEGTEALGLLSLIAGLPYHFEEDANVRSKLASEAKTFVGTLDKFLIYLAKHPELHRDVPSAQDDGHIREIMVNRIAIGGIDDAFRNTIAKVVEAFGGASDASALLRFAKQTEQGVNQKFGGNIIGLINGFGKGK